MNADLVLRTADLSYERDMYSFSSEDDQEFEEMSDPDDAEDDSSTDENARKNSYRRRLARKPITQRPLRAGPLDDVESYVSIIRPPTSSGSSEMM